MTAKDTVQNWTADEVISVIRELAQKSDLPERLIKRKIKGHDTIETLGIDSIGGVYLIERFEELTGTLMPDDFVELDFSIEDIAARLNRLVSEKD